MKRLYVVAGGVGVAPLAYLVQSWGKRGKEGEVVAYLGAKSQAGLLGIDELKPWCSRVEVATDDGSQGFFGTVVAAFQRDLPHITDEETALYVCGPGEVVRQTGFPTPWSRYLLSGVLGGANGLWYWGLSRLRHCREKSDGEDLLPTHLCRRAGL